MINDKAVGGVHWGFWAVAAVALVWNLMGVMNLFMQMDADTVASMPDTHRAIIDGRPGWATGGFAVAVFGGAMGSIFLLLRKSAALYLFVASLAGVLVTMIHTGIVSSTSNFSLFDIVMMILMPIAMAAFLVWYSKQAQSRGWIG